MRQVVLRTGNHETDGSIEINQGKCYGGFEKACFVNSGSWVRVLSPAPPELSNSIRDSSDAFERLQSYLRITRTDCLEDQKSIETWS